MDEIDMKIISLLRENSRLTWKDIGKKIHMTGQAVGLRIKKLEESNIIKSYTILTDNIETGNFIAFITAIMKGNDHNGLRIYLKNEESIISAHRISGDGCYLIKAKVESNDKLNSILDEILKYANYRLNKVFVHKVSWI